MNFNFENLGALTSPEDKRDFNLASIQAPQAYPEAYKTDLSGVPVLNQGHQPACVAHSLASAMMYDFDGLNGSKDFSPRFLYALSKKIDGIPDSPGTYARTALKQAQTYGDCDNSDFPNDVSLDKDIYKNSELIPQLAFDDASERAITSYARVTDLSFEGLKQAIYQNKLVLMILKLDNQWWIGDNPLPMKPPLGGDLQHQVLLYGYDKNYIYFRNSWSENWGQNGDGYFGSNYIPYLVEGWTFVELTQSQINGLKSKIAILRNIAALYIKIVGLLKWSMKT